MSAKVRYAGGRERASFPSPIHFDNILQYRPAYYKTRFNFCCCCWKLLKIEETVQPRILPQPKNEQPFLFPQGRAHLLPKYPRLPGRLTRHNTQNIEFWSLKTNNSRKIPSRNDAPPCSRKVRNQALERNFGFLRAGQAGPGRAGPGWYCI